MFIPPILFTAAAAAVHAWLSGDAGPAPPAGPFADLDAIPDGMTPEAAIRHLEAAGEYESADALQRSVWQWKRTRGG